MRRFFSVILLVLATISSADANVIKSPERIITLIKEAAASKTPGELDRILRNASMEPSAYDTEKTTAYGVVWYDNWNPRARVWLKGVDADHLFRDILIDEYLLEAVDIDGRVDVELEIRAGYPATIKGRLKLLDANLKWTSGDFALTGASGYLPFRRMIGTEEAFALVPPQLSEPNLQIREVVWAGRSVASNVGAIASYNDKVLRFNKMKLMIMGGEGEGSVLMDHRGPRWRAASMVKFEDIDLNRLPELLPGLPLFARVTSAVVKGHVGLIFEAPDRIRLTGSMESLGPGYIELSPMMHTRVRNLIDSRVVNFQHLTLELAEDKDGNPEARVSLQRRTAQSVYELWRGAPFSPVMVTVRIPLIPFVHELSQE